MISEAEDKWRRLLEHGPVGMFRAALGGRVLDCNPALVRILGFSSAADLLGKPAVEFYWSAEDRDRVFERLGENDFVTGAEVRFKRADGAPVWVRLNVRFDGDDSTIVEGTALDVTDYKLAQERVAQLNRLYSVLSRVGQAIVRSTEREPLVAEVCRIAVEDGGFRMAWFGAPETGDGLLVPVARYGHEDGYLEHVRISVDEAGPGGHSVSNDLSADSGVGPWRDEAVKRGYRSSAAFPVTVGKRLAGVLHLYAAERGFFDEQTVELLAAVAGDLSFALESMEHEAERRSAEQERARLYLSEQAARAQAKADARFRELLEAAPDAILEGDAGGRILLVNAAAERLFGYTRAELLTRNISDLIPQPASQTDRGEHRVLARRKDGSEFPVEISVSPVKAEQGELVTCIVRDITLRMRAEDALRKSDRRIGSILESITDAFVALDRDWRFTYLNNRAEQVVGRKREDLQGKCVWEEFPEMVGSEFYTECHRAAAEQRPIEFSTHYAPLKLWMDVHAYPSDGGLSLYFQDVTTRRSIEEQSAQSQRLEALGRLAGGVAHDFNNLLTIIGGYGQMVLDAVDARSDLGKDVQIVVDAALRASTLTRQLLAFSRRQVVQPKILDLNRLIVKMGKMLRRLIGEDIELRLELRSDLGRILADPGQVEQVIMNLAVNARDAMPTGGRLSIRTDNRAVAQRSESAPQLAPGEYVLLAVSDTGTGIDEQTRSHIFEPFFTTKGKGKGTGLGLATVYGIAKQSGAEISVDSEPGQGACFQIHFPRASKTHKTRHGVTRALPPRGTETILLVEDDPEVRALARSMLSRLGYRVIEAGGPTEALDLFQTERESVDLLLTDVIMPRMNGRELAEWMSAERPGLKVLYFSGYTDDVIERYGIAVGAALLRKPFSREALGSKVRAILDERQVDAAAC